MGSMRVVGISAIVLAVAAASFLLQAQSGPPAATVAAAVPVTITVDASKVTGDLQPIWRWCGYDEPNYTYAPNGKKLVNQFTGDKNSPFGAAYFRAHSLLVTGDGTPHLKWGSTNAYTEDAAGKPVYDWTILDRIFGTYLDAGARPFVQIGFMPKALSLRPEPYEHHWKPGDNYNDIYLGWTTPPKDYDKWRELNFQWAKHCVEKYGMEEVKKWYWEVWNEPNIGYFTAAQRGGNKVVDYEKVWDYAADGIRKAIPDAIISGAETAGDGGAFQRDFIEHCLNGTNYATGKTGSPLGMISFHAKGSPVAGLGHVRMGVQAQLATINAGFRIVAARPETAKLPVVIGESDPDGCAACQSYKGLYPEYGYRNGSIFAAYTIEQLTRTMDLAQRNKVHLLGAVTWAFEFEDQPIFGGFRALATDGVALPVLNTFRMLNKMGTKRVAVTSTGDLGLDAIVAPLNRGGGVRGEKSDVHALASRDERRITIIAWNYHDDDVPGPAADITLDLSGLPDDLHAARLTEWRVDETHSNAYTVWKKMGSPEKPTAEQHQQLEAASELEKVRNGVATAVAEGKAAVKLNVPRQAVCLVEVVW
jgi:xylan 1,4-beta-xylosidase